MSSFGASWRLGMPGVVMVGITMFALGQSELPALAGNALRGMFVPIALWSLVLLPVLFAATGATRLLFVATMLVVGVSAFTGWVAMAGLGYRFTESTTASLSGHLYVHKQGAPFKKGDLVAFRWPGGATYPRGTVFIKRVVGVPGDAVRRDGSDFWVGSYHVGRAKPVSKAGVPLEPAGGGVIPEGHYFVATEHPDSLDSRYALTGNIPAQLVVGRAHELF